MTTPCHEMSPFMAIFFLFYFFINNVDIFFISPLKYQGHSEPELVFVKHYAPNCLTLTLLDSNTLAHDGF